MKFFNVLFIAVLLLLLSCKQSPKQLGAVLKVSSLDSMEVFNAGSNFNISNYKSKPYKLFTSINVSCASCIEKVEIWNRIIKNINADKIAFFPIAHTKDNFETFKYLFQSGSIKNVQIPFFLDI